MSVSIGVNSMRFRTGLIVLALLFGFAALPEPLRAEGALAVGLTPNFARDGFAVGGAINFPNRDEAERRALQECRGFKGAPDAVKRCAIVANFRRECYAIAFDPADDTHGYGFAVAQTRALAEDRAMGACEMRSDDRRKGRCVLNLVRCDERD